MLMNEEKVVSFYDARRSVLWYRRYKRDTTCKVFVSVDFSFFHGLELLKSLLIKYHFRAF